MELLKLPDVYNLPTYLKVLLLLSPLIAILCVFFLAPILWMFFYSFYRWDPIKLVDYSVVTPENYIRAFSDPLFLEGLFNSLLLSLASTIASLVLGYPISYYMTKMGSTQRTVATIIILSPLFTSAVVTSFAWRVLLQTSGLVNSILLYLGLLSSPIRFYGNPLGVIIVLAYTFSPFLILSVNASLEAIHPEQIRAAENLGASPAKTFLRIIFPQSIPGVLYGCLLTFTLCISSFIGPFILGGRIVKMYPVFVYDFISVRMNLPLGSATAVLLLAIVLVLNVAISESTTRARLRWTTSN